MMMETIVVDTKGHSYEVHIGEDAYKVFGQQYSEFLQTFDTVVVIADEKVASFHLNRLLNHLQPLVRNDIKVKLIPAGESSKTIDTFFDCQTFLMETKCTRKSCVIAFGGGSCGDLSGFVASTFMRGIPFIQCPTTILAHDSAVGGKTA